MIDNDLYELEPAPLPVQLERACELIRQLREVIVRLEEENAALRGTPKGPQ
jgi:hypothetical protein